VSDSATTSMRTIKLSKLDVTYLANAQFLPDDLARIVSGAVATDNDARLLALDRATAERFRGEFTTRLARVGFGQAYEPTREGKLLEALIDRFAAEK
jgi:putative heme iron utilization protein